MHGVCIASHNPGAGAHVIGDDPIAALASPFAFRMIDYVLGLRCEDNDEFRAATIHLAQGLEDVRVFHQR